MINDIYQSKFNFVLNSPIRTINFRYLCTLYVLHFID